MSSSSPSPDFAAVDPGNFQPIPRIAPVQRKYLCALPAFGVENLAGSTADQQMFRIIPSATTAATPIVMPRPGSIVAITAASSTARTAGTATFSVWKNGVETAVTCVLDGAVTQYAFGNPIVPDGFKPGDQLATRVSTSGWTPTTADVEAVIWVEIEGGTQPPAAAPGGERT